MRNQENLAVLDRESRANNRSANKASVQAWTLKWVWVLRDLLKASQALGIVQV